MEQIIVASPLTKTTTLDSIMCVLLAPVSVLSLSATISTLLSKQITVNSNIDLEDV